ncbi:carboxypeptidase-like regulatory domain-containing protein [Arenibacter nanhaiticus]|uniref:carboxypeptidase-like regulatory domain-containing protein n=1 Tax=Arenibacter nanhaiticus TaxID=558155 RepID=UPI001FE48A40|nr:carboxypeptidase-like regulatory domain-containing protein [Arenibacter nanhaiticus]
MAEKSLVYMVFFKEMGHLGKWGFKVLLLFIGLCAISTYGYGQSLGEKIIEGKVYSKDGDVAATHVLNTTTKKATITNIDGFFTIVVQLNDTLVFSAVQYQRKNIVINEAILESSFLSIPLEESNIALDEVIVMPYNLSGDLSRDMGNMSTPSVITSSTLGLPNAYIRIPTKAERQLYEATSGGGFIPLFPIINGISGRTKQLKELVATQKKYARTQRVKSFFQDSVYVKDLNIPQGKLDDFFYFCEIDPVFSLLVETGDQLKLLDYLKEKSQNYRENNGLN